MSICNPIIVMNAGTILTQGTAETIKNDERVINAYLGD
jgi:branched-chain amino acid transport system ATP-binding protein